MKHIDLTGQRFDRLVALERIGTEKWGGAIWLCQCNCGRRKEIAARVLRRGHARSCGCLISETAIKRCTKHGMFGTPTYRVWAGMISRCHSENNKDYPKYGARGVQVCDRWRSSFEAFFADMGERPTGLSIDRIDNDKGYAPGNCRWATAQEQTQNRKACKLSVQAAREIRRRAASGESRIALAIAYGVSQQSISKLLLGETWKNAI